MGLFSKLFGKKESEAEVRRARTIDAVRAATAEPMSCEKCYNKLAEALPGDADAELKLDVINALFEMERNDYAEAMAKRVASEEDAPLPLVKGLTRHFMENGRLEEVEEPVKRLVLEKPSESEFAVELGRVMMRRKEHEELVKVLDPAVMTTQDRHLFALMGEAHYALDQHEDAVNFLRTAAEMYQEAFQLHRVLPDDMNQEQLEYQRVFSLLEDAAKKHGGDETLAEAFENITLQPSSFGLVKEADALATGHTEYQPLMKELWPVEKLRERAEAIGDDDLDSQPRRLFLLGSAALRERRFSEAITCFRETLEYDLEAFGAYYGWAAGDALQRHEPIADQEELDGEAMDQLQKVCPDWPAMTARERNVVLAAMGPLAAWVHKLAEAECTSRVHPMDVRLRDLYPEKCEMRFESPEKSPQAQGAFASAGHAHTRLDEFLFVRPVQFTFALVTGYLVADAIKKDSKLEKKARALMSKAGSKPSNFEEFIAGACESLATLTLFGDEAKSEFSEDLEKIGALEFLRSGG